MGGATNPLIQLFYVHLFGGAMLIAGKSVLMGWGDLRAIDGAVFALMQYSALGAGLLGFGFMFNALKRIPASLVSLICTLELVFALIITPLVLGLLSHWVRACWLRDNNGRGGLRDGTEKGGKIIVSLFFPPFTVSCGSFAYLTDTNDSGIIHLTKTRDGHVRERGRLTLWEKRC